MAVTQTARFHRVLALLSILEIYLVITRDETWVRVASTAVMREGQGFDTGCEVAGENVGLFLIDGVYYAVGECTHERGPVCQGHREGLEVSCPWHSSRFNVATGACVQGPVACRVDGSVLMETIEEVDPIEPLACFEVMIEGEDIFVRPRSQKNLP